MDQILNKNIITGKIKIYKQSRMAYFFYYLITFFFLFLAFFVKWNVIFRNGCFVLFFLFLLYFEILISVNHLVVDDVKIELRRGFFNITRKSVPLNMITDFKVRQNFLQSILGYGTLELNTGGGEFYELSMKRLRNPTKILRDIENRIGRLNYIRKQDNISVKRNQ